MRGATTFPTLLRAANSTCIFLHHVTPSSSSSASRSLTTSSAPTTPFDSETYLSSARAKFAAQPPTLIPDILSPTPSRLLTLSLADHVRPTLYPPGLDAAALQNHHHHHLPSSTSSGGQDPGPILPQGHHLVYFPLQLPPSALMPDGTDPAHWPGGPFVRRMWAGGEVVFHDGWDAALRVDGRAAVCVESVVGAPVLRVGRREGEEKVFVDVRREYGLEEGRGVVEEVRRLVFLREREGRSGEESSERVVRASAAPEFTFSLTPDVKLLFHFSALTYNAHAIHIDPDYARNREGYRGLLVHGPLTLVLMLSALRACLARLQQGGETTAKLPFVRSLNYRNLAPLYVNEEMKVCLRRNRTEGDQINWDVWIEGPQRGLAVKGYAISTGGSLAA